MNLHGVPRAPCLFAEVGATLPLPYRGEEHPLHDSLYEYNEHKTVNIHQVAFATDFCMSIIGGKKISMLCKAMEGTAVECIAVDFADDTRIRLMYISVFKYLAAAMAAASDGYPVITVAMPFMEIRGRLLTALFLKNQKPSNQKRELKQFLVERLTAPQTFIINLSPNLMTHIPAAHYYVLSYQPSVRLVKALTLPAYNDLLSRYPVDSGTYMMLHQFAMMNQDAFTVRNTAGMEFPAPTITDDELRGKYSEMDGGPAMVVLSPGEFHQKVWQGSSTVVRPHITRDWEQLPFARSDANRSLTRPRRMRGRRTGRHRHC